MSAPDPPSRSSVPAPKGELRPEDHSRDAAGLTYVYPVVSRRAQGVSIGVNLNPNNACNWACVYCQVPNLVRGAAPEIDLDLLEDELRGFLSLVQTGAWMESHVPEGARRLNDIAFSGNGEPTTAAGFDEVVHRVLAVRNELPRALQESLRTVLITNGSQMHRPEVINGLHALGRAGGEVWFKLDRVGQETRLMVNGARGSVASIRERLRASAGACPTKIQTCMFKVDGLAPSLGDVEAYITFLEEEVKAGTPLHGILVYGLARPSAQPDAGRLDRLDSAWLERFARNVEERTGISVSVHP